MIGRLSTGSTKSSSAKPRQSLGNEESSPPPRKAALPSFNTRKSDATPTKATGTNSATAGASTSTLDSSEPKRIKPAGSTTPSSSKKLASTATAQSIHGSPQKSSQLGSISGSSIKSSSISASNSSIIDRAVDSSAAIEVAVQPNKISDVVEEVDLEVERTEFVISKEVIEVDIREEHELGVFSFVGTSTNQPLPVDNDGLSTQSIVANIISTSNQDVVSSNDVSSDIAVIELGQPVTKAQLKSVGEVKKSELKTVRKDSSIKTGSSKVSSIAASTTTGSKGTPDKSLIAKKPALPVINSASSLKSTTVSTQKSLMPKSVSAVETKSTSKAVGSTKALKTTAIPPPATVQIDTGAIAIVDVVNAQYSEAAINDSEITEIATVVTESEVVLQTEIVIDREVINVEEIEINGIEESSLRSYQTGGVEDASLPNDNVADSMLANQIEASDLEYGIVEQEAEVAIDIVVDAVTEEKSKLTNNESKSNVIEAKQSIESKSPAGKSPVKTAVGSKAVAGTLSSSAGVKGRASTGSLLPKSTSDISNSRASGKAITPTKPVLPTTTPSSNKAASTASTPSKSALSTNSTPAKSRASTTPSTAKSDRAAKATPTSATPPTRSNDEPSVPPPTILITVDPPLASAQVDTGATAQADNVSAQLKEVVLTDLVNAEINTVVTESDVVLQTEIVIEQDVINVEEIEVNRFGEIRSGIVEQEAQFAADIAVDAVTEEKSKSTNHDSKSNVVEARKSIESKSPGSTSPVKTAVGSKAVASTLSNSAGVKGRTSTGSLLPKSTPTKPALPTTTSSSKAASAAGTPSKSTTPTPTKARISTTLSAGKSEETAKVASTSATQQAKANDEASVAQPTISNLEASLVMQVPIIRNAEEAESIASTAPAVAVESLSIATSTADTIDDTVQPVYEGDVYTSPKIHDENTAHEIIVSSNSLVPSTQEEHLVSVAPSMSATPVSTPSKSATSGPKKSAKSPAVVATPLTGRKSIDAPKVPSKAPLPAFSKSTPAKAKDVRQDSAPKASKSETPKTDASMSAIAQSVAELMKGSKVSDEAINSLEGTNVSVTDATTDAVVVIASESDVQVPMDAGTEIVAQESSDGKAAVPSVSSTSPAAKAMKPVSKPALKSAASATIANTERPSTKSTAKPSLPVFKKKSTTVATSTVAVVSLPNTEATDLEEADPVEDGAAEKHEPVVIEEVEKPVTLESIADIKSIAVSSKSATTPPKVSVGSGKSSSATESAKTSNTRTSSTRTSLKPSLPSFAKSSSASNSSKTKVESLAKDSAKPIAASATQQAMTAVDAEEINLEEQIMEEPIMETQTSAVASEVAQALKREAAIEAKSNNPTTPSKSPSSRSTPSSRKPALPSFGRKESSERLINSNSRKSTPSSAMKAESPSMGNESNTDSFTELDSSNIPSLKELRKTLRVQTELFDDNEDDNDDSRNPSSNRSSRPSSTKSKGSTSSTPRSRSTTVIPLSRRKGSLEAISTDAGDRNADGVADSIYCSDTSATVDIDRDNTEAEISAINESVVELGLYSSPSYTPTTNAQRRPSSQMTVRVNNFTTARAPKSASTTPSGKSSSNSTTPRSKPTTPSSKAATPKFSATTPKSATASTPKSSESKEIIPPMRRRSEDSVSLSSLQYDGQTWVLADVPLGIPQTNSPREIAQLRRDGFDVAKYSDISASETGDLSSTGGRKMTRKSKSFYSDTSSLEGSLGSYTRPTKSDLTKALETTFGEPVSDVAVSTARLYVGESNIRHGLPAVLKSMPISPVKKASPGKKSPSRPEQQPNSGLSQLDIDLSMLNQKALSEEGKLSTDWVSDMDASTLSSNSQHMSQRPEMERLKMISAREAAMQGLRIKEIAIQKEQTRLKDLACREVAAAAQKAREDAEKLFVERVRTLAMKEMAVITERTHASTEKLSHEKVRQLVAKEVVTVAQNAKVEAERSALAKIRSLIVENGDGESVGWRAKVNEEIQTVQLRRLASLEVAAASSRAKEEGSRQIEESLFQKCIEETQSISVKAQESAEREAQDVIMKIVSKEIAAAASLVRENTDKEINDRMRRLSDSEFFNASSEVAEAANNEAARQSAVYERAKLLNSREFQAVTFRAKEIAEKETMEIFKKLAADEVAAVTHKYTTELEEKVTKSLKRVASLEVMAGAITASQAAEKATQDSLRKSASKEISKRDLPPRPANVSPRRSPAPARRDSKSPSSVRSNSFTSSPSSSPRSSFASASTPLSATGSVTSNLFVSDSQVESEGIASDIFGFGDATTIPVATRSVEDIPIEDDQLETEVAAIVEAEVIAADISIDEIDRTDETIGQENSDVVEGEAVVASDQLSNSEVGIVVSELQSSSIPSDRRGDEVMLAAEVANTATNVGSDPFEFNSSPLGLRPSAQELSYGESDDAKVVEAPTEFAHHQIVDNTVEDGETAEESESMSFDLNIDVKESLTPEKKPRVSFGSPLVIISPIMDSPVKPVRKPAISRSKSTSSVTDRTAKAALAKEPVQSPKASLKAPLPKLNIKPGVSSAGAAANSSTTPSASISASSANSSAAKRRSLPTSKSMSLLPTTPSSSSIVSRQSMTALKEAIPEIVANRARTKTKPSVPSFSKSTSSTSSPRLSSGKGSEPARSKKPATAPPEATEVSEFKIGEENGAANVVTAEEVNPDILELVGVAANVVDEAEDSTEVVAEEVSAHVLVSEVTETQSSSATKDSNQHPSDESDVDTGAERSMMQAILDRLNISHQPPSLIPSLAPKVVVAPITVTPASGHSPTTTPISTPTSTPSTPSSRKTSRSKSISLGESLRTAEKTPSPRMRSGSISGLSPSTPKSAGSVKSPGASPRHSIASHPGLQSSTSKAKTTPDSNSKAAASRKPSIPSFKRANSDKDEELKAATTSLSPKSAAAVLFAGADGVSDESSVLSTTEKASPKKKPSPIDASIQENAIMLLNATPTPSGNNSFATAAHTPSATPVKGSMPQFKSPKIAGATSGKDKESKEKVPIWNKGTQSSSSKDLKPSKASPSIPTSRLQRQTQTGGNSDNSLASLASQSSGTKASADKTPDSAKIRRRSDTGSGTSSPKSMVRRNSGGGTSQSSLLALLDEEADKPARTLKGRRNSNKSNETLEFQEENGSTISLKDLEAGVSIRRVHSKFQLQCKCYYPDCTRVMNNATCFMCTVCNSYSCPRHSVDKDGSENGDSTATEGKQQRLHYCIHCYAREIGEADPNTLISQTPREQHPSNDDSSDDDDDDSVDQSQVIPIEMRPEVLDKMNILDHMHLPVIVELDETACTSPMATSVEQSFKATAEIVPESAHDSVVEAVVQPADKPIETPPASQVVEHPKKARPSESAAVAESNKAGSDAVEALISQWTKRRPTLSVDVDSGSDSRSLPSTPSISTGTNSVANSNPTTPSSAASSIAGSATTFQSSQSNAVKALAKSPVTVETIPEECDTTCTTELDNAGDDSSRKDAEKLQAMTRNLTLSMISDWEKKYSTHSLNDDEMTDEAKFQRYQQFRIYSNSAIPIQAVIRGYLCRRNILLQVNTHGEISTVAKKTLTSMPSFHVADMLTQWDKKYSATKLEHDQFVAAATKIQARCRGHLLRMKLDPASLLNARLVEMWTRKYAVKDPLANSFAEYQLYRTFFNAAIIIQSLLRGANIRIHSKYGKIVRANKYFKVLNSVIAEYNSMDLSTLSFEEYQTYKVYNNSATALQSVFRGYMARMYPFGFLPFKLPTSPRAKESTQSLINKPFPSALPLVSFSRKLTKGVTFYLKNEEDSDEEEEKEIILHKSSTGELRKPFSLPCSLTVMSINGSTRGRHFDPEADKGGSGSGSGSGNSRSGGGFGFGNRDSFKSMQSEDGDVSVGDIINGNDESFWDCFESDRDSDASGDAEVDEDAKERNMEEELRKIEEIMAFNFEASLALQHEVEFDVSEIVEENGSDDDDDSNIASRDDEFGIGGSFVSSASTDSLISNGGGVNTSSNAIPVGNKVRTLSKTRSAIEREKARGLSRTDSKVFRKNAKQAPPPPQTNSLNADSLGVIKEESDSELDDEEVLSPSKSQLGKLKDDDFLGFGGDMLGNQAVQVLNQKSDSYYGVVPTDVNSATPELAEQPALPAIAAEAPETVTANQQQSEELSDLLTSSQEENLEPNPRELGVGVSFQQSDVAAGVDDNAEPDISVTDLPIPVELNEFLETDTFEMDQRSAGCIDSFTEYINNHLVAGVSILTGTPVKSKSSTSTPQSRRRQKDRYSSAKKLGVLSPREQFDIDAECQTTPPPTRASQFSYDGDQEDDFNDVPVSCFDMQPLLHALGTTPQKRRN